MSNPLKCLARLLKDGLFRICGVVSSCLVGKGMRRWIFGLVRCGVYFGHEAWGLGLGAWRARRARGIGPLPSSKQARTGAFEFNANVPGDKVIVEEHTMVWVFDCNQWVQ